MLNPGYPSKHLNLSPQTFLANFSCLSHLILQDSPRPRHGKTLFTKNREPLENCLNQCSQWGSPSVLVQDKDGRHCVVPSDLYPNLPGNLVERAMARPSQTTNVSHWGACYFCQSQREYYLK
ncbi:hypothetical protein L873DRAFT_825967 [Choiromyces venosus 120613-1]|uniref:Uncharacterized protein n=1 Tax=Choiromyces venosus 120613-1 TaxID=1336337 RepID=A0A3N4JTI9_9PEZI|nr:hypothetical protein L873DRAFT_825967 [Choiromyces venosus 120613-1]